MKKVLAFFIWIALFYAYVKVADYYSDKLVLATLAVMALFIIITFIVVSYLFQEPDSRTKQEKEELKALQYYLRQEDQIKKDNAKRAERSYKEWRKKNDLHI